MLDSIKLINLAIKHGCLSLSDICKVCIEIKKGMKEIQDTFKENKQLKEELKGARNMIPQLHDDIRNLKQKLEIERQRKIGHIEETVYLKQKLEKIKELRNMCEKLIKSSIKPEWSTFVNDVDKILEEKE